MNLSYTGGDKIKKLNRIGKTCIVLLIALIFLSFYPITCIAHYSMYDNDTYDCKHMSRDLEDKLESWGIPVTICIGYIENLSSGHMWIKVFGINIDSVSLLPDENSEYCNLRMEFNDYQDYLDWRVD